jgi:homoserine kinase type II
MLWESDDPENVLTERFGFADAAGVVDWMGDVLRDTWAISVDDCDRLVMSAGNLLAWIRADDRRLIAKLSVFPSLLRQGAGEEERAPSPARAPTSSWC